MHIERLRRQTEDGGALAGQQPDVDRDGCCLHRPAHFPAPNVCVLYKYMYVAARPDFLRLHYRLRHLQRKVCSGSWPVVWEETRTAIQSFLFFLLFFLKKESFTYHRLVNTKVRIRRSHCYSHD